MVAFGGEQTALTRCEGAIDLARRSGLVTRVKASIGRGYLRACRMGRSARAFLMSAFLIDRKVQNLTVRDIMTVFNCVLVGGGAVPQVAPGLTCLAEARRCVTRFYHIKSHPAEIQHVHTDERPVFHGDHADADPELRLLARTHEPRRIEPPP